MMEVSLFHYLVVSAILFILGLINISTRKNAIGLLFGVELILNSASLNFVAFSQKGIGNLSGVVFSIFIIALAAAEVCIALAIVIAIFHHFKTIDADKVSTMKG